MGFRRSVGTVSAIAALWAGACATPARAQAQPEDLASFDQVWTTIRDTHWQKQPGGLDWDKIRDEYRPRVERSTSTAEARGVMAEMLVRLKETHFAIVPAAVYRTIDAGETAPGEASPGIELRVLENEAVVTAVEPGSPADKSGVHPGWIVAEVTEPNGNKTKMRKVIDQAAKNPQIHELQLTRSLESRWTGAAGDYRDVTFLGGQNHEVTLRLALAPPRGKLAEFGNLPPTYVWYEGKRMGNVGYVRFNVFLDIPRLLPAFEKSVEDCLKCSGLIIDLRGNPGGIGGMAMGMAGFLVDKQGEQLGTMYMRDATLNFVVNPRPQVFAGPVAILMDANAASTAEIFAGGLQALKRARVFGTLSAAAALPSVFTRLPNGDGFQYAIANYVSVSGQTLEGQGVHPDEEVKLTRQSLLAGHDAVVDAALDWIQTGKIKRAGNQK